MSGFCKDKVSAASSCGAALPRSMDRDSMNASAMRSNDWQSSYCGLHDSTVEAICSMESRTLRNSVRSAASEFPMQCRNVTM
mgnify:CR=1 FL=1